MGAPRFVFIVYIDEGLETVFSGDEGLETVFSGMWSLWAFR
jgi:hypothetical protein